MRRYSNYATSEFQTVESRRGAVAPDYAPFPRPAHRTGRAGFPHPALGEGSCVCSRQAARIPLQLQQPESLLEPAVPLPAGVHSGVFVFGKPPLSEPVRNVRVDRPVGFGAGSQSEVTGPSPQNGVEFGDHLFGTELPGVSARHRADLFAQSHDAFPRPTRSTRRVVPLFKSLDLICQKSAVVGRACHITIPKRRQCLM